MLKIWARTVAGEKITRDLLYKKEGSYNPSLMMEYLTEICYTFDIPTPIILKNHIQNFERFNITRFKESDFVDIIDFDALVIENASE